MIRVLIFILWGAVLALLVTGLSSLDGRFVTEIFGQKISAPAGLAISIVLAAFALTVIGTIALNYFWRLPSKLKAKEEKHRLTRGMAALTRGLESVAAGDGADALHHARIAKRNLGDEAMTRLLTAQAAQLSGDEKTAGESFTAMLEAPETEFLGLRGLYAKAVRDGDEEAALRAAERAFTLRPNAVWAFESVFDLALQRGAWGEARSYLKPASRNKAIAPDKAKRAEAALLTAEAYASHDSADASALDEAEKAFKIAPGFAPAAVLAARLHHNAGRAGRAEKILEQAYAANPHISLISALANLYGASEAAKGASMLRKLAGRAPDAPESRIAETRAHLLEADYQAAVDALEPILAEQADARACAMMAEAITGLHGEGAARGWLARAAAAERDPTPGGDGVFSFTRAGWAQLVKDYRDDGRLAPPPLEGPPAGLTEDDFKLLAPPAAALPAPENDVKDEQDRDQADAAAASATGSEETAPGADGGESAPEPSLSEPSPSELAASEGDDLKGDLDDARDDANAEAAPEKKTAGGSLA